MREDKCSGTHPYVGTVMTVQLGTSLPAVTYLVLGERVCRRMQLQAHLQLLLEQRPQLAEVFDHQLQGIYACDTRRGRGDTS